MKLTSLPHSPFAARIRMQINTKQLPIEIVQPDTTITKDALIALSPLQKIPALLLNTQEVLVESSAIAEYLEDFSSAIPCLPTNPQQKATVRATVSIANTHVGPLLFELFKALGKEHTEAEISALWKPLETLFERYENWLTQNPVNLDNFHIGDFAMATNLWYIEELASLQGYELAIEKYPSINAWWRRCNDESCINNVLAEMRIGFNNMLGR